MKYRMQQRPQNILRLENMVNNRLQKNSELQIFNSYFQILQRHEHRVYHFFTFSAIFAYKHSTIYSSQSTLKKDSFQKYR